MRFDKKLPIIYKTAKEIEAIRESALLVSKTLGLIASEIRPGITTEYLDKLAEEFIRDNHGIPAFKGHPSGSDAPPFPGTLCLSVNSEIVHGIPSKRELRDGDVLSVDCGVIKNDFYGDHAYTFPVGEVKPEVMKLLKVTKECLYLGIEQMQVGKRVGDISYAIQQHAEKNGFTIVRELVGHGVGKMLHEGPEVPNFGKRGTGPVLQNGVVLAIEPMINLGKKDVKQLADGWTIVAADGKPSAHFEHDIAIINGKAQILSTFDYIDAALEKNRNAVAI
ncbi:type I methionyl aminopeptidase [Thermoflexibacter ruber]|uniref:Methionine aminopeptidase n=1 Tax=Thermoflexibacter ruber TaxID=1003 RepID=A0A1I2AXS8_9BACT|nr:type I methionyl aminopeptidase [Thermoflexibacter ruber]SFE48569.1 methionine aminopeptidase, type I [Thermoflexibacter ruber]